MKKNKSFTLIELLISISIFAIIMTAIYASFNTGVLGIRQIEENSRVLRTAYLVLSRINKDLRNSFAYCDDQVKFAGSKGALSFLSLTPDFSFISYSLDGNKLLRLIRVNKDAFKDDSETKSRVLAKNVKQIEFTYLALNPNTKNIQETDSWSDSAALPLAVRVSLTLEKREASPFVRTIYLTQEK